MKKILPFLLLFLIATNAYSEMRQDGSYIAPTSVKGVCQELEKSIVAYNKSWVESNKAWADAFNAKKTNDLASMKNNSDLLKSNLDDVIGRWNKLECASILYPR
jgi:hypothetical protein